MDEISLSDLEIHCRVGVTEAERLQPQRLLIGLQIGFPLARAARTDRLTDTINYQAVALAVLRLAQERQWNLIETVAGDIARLVLNEFKAKRVTVEVQKFVIPQTRCVSVRITRRSR
jgi:7,8-dihydroneopterin aldolase/epimerase/oxygenase